MAPESSIDLDPPPTSPVVEFGPDPAPLPRRWSATGFGRNMLADRRLVPVCAALGAVAVLGSLISEWQVTTVDAAFYGDGQVGSRLLATDLGDVGGLGTGYVIGLFPLIAAVVLTMFGPPAGRRYLRLAGLSIGGTLLGLLVALAASLRGDSRAIPRIYVLQLDERQLVVGYGRGVWCAFAAVLLGILALYLVDRHLPAEPDPIGELDEDDEEATAVWSWRRPPADEDDEEPLELTVAPAQPFSSSPVDRDKPT